MTCPSEFGIEPSRFYRRSSEQTRAILGLSEGAINTAIKDGSLPLPVPLTQHGRACGWYGWQLVELVRARMELVSAREAKRKAGAFDRTPPPTKRKV
jgi:hypothetical protein